MAERLYQKLKLSDGRKAYASTIHGRRVRLFKQASAAQAHALKLRERYKRLKAAEPKKDSTS